MSDTRAIQQRLSDLGYDPGGVDGVFGDLTKAAVKQFQRARGLNVDGVVGPVTRQALWPDRVAKLAPAAPSDMPVWMRNAIAEIGVREVTGKDSNGRIIAYRVLGHTTADTSTEDGSRPWCADFMCAMLETAGVRSPRSGMARAIEHDPRFVRLDGPALGAIVTMWRGSKSSGLGHVYFYAGQDAEGRNIAVGGNQSDAVTAAAYGTSRVVAYWWPAGQPLPKTGHVPAVIRAGALAGSEV